MNSIHLSQPTRNRTKSDENALGSIPVTKSPLIERDRLASIYKETMKEYAELKKTLQELEENDAEIFEDEEIWRIQTKLREKGRVITACKAEMARHDRMAKLSELIRNKIMVSRVKAKYWCRK